MGVKAYGKDETVLNHGDRAANIWLVQHGWVKLVRQTPDGKETVIGLCAEGDVFGEAALFANANYPYYAISLTEDTELVSIPAEVMRALVKENNELSASVMAMLNTRTAQVQLKLEHMSTMSAAQRLGCFLLRLCHTQVGGSKMLKIPVEKHILAAYLGMKPETLSRSQQQLTPIGITVNGQHIKVDDIETLRDYVCGSCSESGSCEAESTAISSV